MGPYQGGQAQYLRVPYADFNGLKLPPSGNEADFILLADIFPTGMMQKHFLYSFELLLTMSFSS